MKKTALALACVAAIPLAAFLITGSGGCARAIESKAEKSINELLPQFLGPADKYETHVKGNPEAMLRGRLRTVHIEGKNVRFTEGLTVARLTVDLEHVAVDRREHRLEGVKTTTFSAKVREAMLNRYAAGRRPGVRDLDITTNGDGTLTVKARPELLGYPTVPVTVRGTLVPRGEGTTLDFVPDGAKVSIIPIPGFVADHIAGRLNPVVDFSGLSLPIRVEKIAVETGAVTLSGTVPSEALLEVAAKAIQQHEPAPASTP